MSRKNSEAGQKPKAGQLSPSSGNSYILRLYVAGATPRSAMAIANIKAICEESLQGRYRLDVIDIYQQPSMAKAEQILATPTLIKHLPAPIRRIVGDLSAKDRVLVGLGLQLCAP